MNEPNICIMASQPLDGEMLHKICKKMAQLTRVIHNMNTRNEQNKVLLKETVREYETEIDRVVNECNALVKKANASAEKNNKAEEAKDKVKKLEADLETEKKKCRKEFEALKVRVEEREKKSATDLEVVFDQRVKTQ